MKSIFLSVESMKFPNHQWMRFVGRQELLVHEIQDNGPRKIYLDTLLYSSNN